MFEFEALLALVARGLCSPDGDIKRGVIPEKVHAVLILCDIDPAELPPRMATSLFDTSVFHWDPDVPGPKGCLQIYADYAEGSPFGISHVPAWVAEVLTQVVLARGAR